MYAEALAEHQQELLGVDVDGLRQTRKVNEQISSYDEEKKENDRGKMWKEESVSEEVISSMSQG